MACAARAALRLRAPPPARRARRALACASSSSSAGDATVPLPAFHSVQELHAELQKLTGDPLEPDGGRVVAFRGHPRARLALIGEAPGAHEDASGVPFVGKAGQLLDKMFGGVGIDLNKHAYVTNVVKRRPPENRDPTPAEMAYYMPWVREELRLVDPWIVVLVGRHAMNAFLGKDEPRGITKARGTWYERDGRAFTVVLHPSYLLRNAGRGEGSPKALTWQDVQEIRHRLDDLYAEDDAR